MSSRESKTEIAETVERIVIVDKSHLIAGF